MKIHTVTNSKNPKKLLIIVYLFIFIQLVGLVFRMYISYEVRVLLQRQSISIPLHNCSFRNCPS